MNFKTIRTKCRFEKFLFLLKFFFETCFNSVTIAREPMESNMFFHGRNPFWAFALSCLFWDTKPIILLFAFSQLTVPSFVSRNLPSSAFLIRAWNRQWPHYGAEEELLLPLVFLFLLDRRSIANCGTLLSRKKKLKRDIDRLIGFFELPNLQEVRLRKLPKFMKTIDSIVRYSSHLLSRLKWY